MGGANGWTGLLNRLMRVLFSEKDDDVVDYDAIAHRLKEDAVSKYVNVEDSIQFRHI